MTQDRMRPDQDPVARPKHAKGLGLPPIPTVPPQVTAPRSKASLRASKPLPPPPIPPDNIGQYREPLRSSGVTTPDTHNATMTRQVSARATRPFLMLAAFVATMVLIVTVQKGITPRAPVDREPTDNPQSLVETRRYALPSPQQPPPTVPPKSRVGSPDDQAAPDVASLPLEPAPEAVVPDVTALPLASPSAEAAESPGSPDTTDDVVRDVSALPLEAPQGPMARDVSMLPLEPSAQPRRRRR